MSPTLGKFSRVVCALVLAQLAGCASFEFTKPMPVQAQPVAIKVSGEDLSAWSDMPLGVYRVPNSQVVISGHQTGQAGALLFGLIGVAIVHSANASAGATMIRDAEKQLNINLNKPLQAEVDRLVAAGAFGPSVKAEPASAKVMLTPAIVLSYVSAQELRPYVVIRTSLAGADGKPVWNTRYIASSGAARPLLGLDSWLENDAAPLKASIQRSLELATGTLARDIAKPFPRVEDQFSVVEGHFPFVKPRLHVKGYPAAEDESTVTFIPKIGDVIVFAGVNVMDKSVIKYRPALKDDVIFKIVEDAKK
ncbi:hypothetical protein GHT07_09785 [Caenimonas koreensis DSM 17982]|uniref:Uncharacterized protein n=1 Tax=Caenimonas koreensis DSM 17982 TaxID=1121255 RepID=A0A844AYT5_9BURK|nr:hypothetical protein [Caenimonas koreensis]MRD47568.1 hypothetical protein [Caenimonas koreensis DSM 17982]